MRGGDAGAGVKFARDTRGTMQPDAAAPAEFPCRLCSATVRARPWGGGECGACGSVNVEHLPSRAELAQFYRAYGVHYQGGGTSEGRNLQRYARKYLQRVDASAVGDRLIDVGSSNSPFPALAARAGFEVTVMDYRRPRDLPESVRFIESSLDDIDLPPGHAHAYDVVCAWAVLEHLPRPMHGAQLLARLCDRGARLHLSMPESGTLLTRHSIGRSPWFYPPEHLHLPSTGAVREIFESFGFELVRSGRLELTAWRYAARYGIGAAEAGAGAVLKALSRPTWQRLRDSRLHRFAGISCFEFVKARA